LIKVKKQGYSLDKILIVDNSPEKLLHDADNAIYVADFRGNVNDQELLLLSKYLPTLHAVKDVRLIEKKHWKNGAHTTKDQ
jgi:RNA polymerase II subunit A small phosphatase-like protein